MTAGVEGRDDLRSIYLREANGLPENWDWVSMRVIGHQNLQPKDWRYAQYDGAVYSTRITRGPRKGRPNTRKPDDGTFRVVILDEQAFKAWLPVWEARTGKCYACKGTGQKWVGWSHDEGNRFVDCPRCGATGNAPTPSLAT